MLLEFFILEALFLCSLIYHYPPTPNPFHSPGSLCTAEDTNFKEFRYAEQIPYCQRNVSSSLKRKVYEDYCVPENERTNYTIDHIIPLSIGGSNKQDNLWPEHKEVKATRPNLEQEVYTELKNGEITQAEAIKIIHEAKF